MLPTEKVCTTTNQTKRNARKKKKKASKEKKYEITLSHSMKMLSQKN